MPLPKEFNIEELPFEDSWNVIDCSNDNRQEKIAEVASFVSKFTRNFSCPLKKSGIAFTKIKNVLSKSAYPRLHYQEVSNLEQLWKN